LLDVGCGSGDFLEKVRLAGWDVSGVDVDDKAVSNARKKGLNIRHGDIGACRETNFDAITLSHVIEHVHDPLALLRGAHARLKPGGCLYIETPNLESVGHRRFGRNWRGLEPPRHLVILSSGSLRLLLAAAGFKMSGSLLRTNHYRYMFHASVLISRHQDPERSTGMSLDWRARLAVLRTHLQPSMQEFLAVTAFKDVR